MAPTIRSGPHACSLAARAAGISLRAALAARRFVQTGNVPGLVTAAMLAVLSACAQVPSNPEARAEFDRNNDPAEPTNRRIFAANQFVDRNALKPVARAYENNVPSRVRRSLHNFTNNLGQPAVAVNDLLQGSFGRAWTTTQRFVINTTVGGAGLFDVATDWGRPGHEADFGQTLGVWGVGPGPAVQLPLLGPSNVRDSIGKLAGLAANPLTFVPGGVISAVRTASGGAGLVDGRAELLPSTDALEKSSLDYYATIRSATAQRRAAFVEEGKTGGTPPAPIQGSPLEERATVPLD